MRKWIVAAISVASLIVLLVAHVTLQLNMYEDNVVTNEEDRGPHYYSVVSNGQYKNVQITQTQSNGCGGTVDIDSIQKGFAVTKVIVSNDVAEKDQVCTMRVVEAEKEIIVKTLSPVIQVEDEDGTVFQRIERK